MISKLQSATTNGSLCSSGSHAHMHKLTITEDSRQEDQALLNFGLVYKLKNTFSHKEM